MSVIIEFLESAPALVSAGHDGLYPYEAHPYDEIYVIALRESASLEDQSVELWLPHKKSVTIANARGAAPEVRVHRSGFMWHDRVREIPQVSDSKWLSIYGFTVEDPRKLGDPVKKLFAVLPGLPMQQSFEELLISERWRQTRDWHTRDREWRPNNIPKITAFEAKRIERDTTLVAQLKSTRGAQCQICGFTFTKVDGTEYCEVHHLECLSSGGLDVPSNCVVLCANCHKRFHYGTVEVLSHTPNQLVVRLDGVEYTCVVG